MLAKNQTRWLAPATPVFAGKPAPTGTAAALKAVVILTFSAPGASALSVRWGSTGLTVNVLRPMNLGCQAMHVAQAIVIVPVTGWVYELRQGFGALLHE